MNGNGDGGVASSSVVNSNDQNIEKKLIGSRKRKRGLVPRKKPQVPEQTVVDDESVVNKESVVDAPAVQTEVVVAADEDDHEPCTMCGRMQPNSMTDFRSNGVMKRTLTSIRRMESKHVEHMLSCVCEPCTCAIKAHKMLTQSLKIRLRRLTNKQIRSYTTSASAARRLEEESAATSASSTTGPQCAPNSNTNNDNTIDTTTDDHDHESVTTSLGSEAKHSVLVTSERPPDSPNTSANAAIPTSTTICGETCNGSITPPPYLPLENAEENSPQVTSTPVPSSSGTGERLSPEKKSSTDAVATSRHTRASENVSTIPQRQIVTRSLSRISVSTSQHSENDLNNSMLAIQSVRTELAYITESGGTVSNYHGSRRKQLACLHCSRTYWRKDHFWKHSRRCNARHRHANKSTRSTKSVPKVDVPAKPVLEPGSCEALAGISASQLFNEVHRCSECRVTVDSAEKLRDHKRLHLKRYYCQVCGREFTARYAYEFHSVVCEAKSEAMKTVTEEKNQTPKSETDQFIGRHTRSRSRALSRIARSRRCNTSIRAGSTHHSLFPNDEKEDDDVSVADTMYTKRMRFTGDWVEDNSQANSISSLCGQLLNDYDDHQISSFEDYDLYLLSILKAQGHLRDVKCFEKHCDFNCTSIVNMMVHDYASHYKKAWFYCKKCNGIFTSKVFLDYHLDSQNDGRFVCYKCGDIYEYQHQLDRHLIRHTKRVNYKCNFCAFEFLTVNELVQHCEMEQHDPHGERILIRIDPTMTISNGGTSPPPPHNRSDGRYNEQIIDMKLPRLPTKRAKPIKEYNIRAGELEFKKQRIRNCWLWPRDLF